MSGALGDPLVVPDMNTTGDGEGDGDTVGEGELLPHPELPRVIRRAVTATATAIAAAKAPRLITLLFATGIFAKGESILCQPASKYCTKGSCKGLYSTTLSISMQKCDILHARLIQEGGGLKGPLLVAYLSTVTDRYCSSI